ncbi:MAG: amidohydrolase family protein [Candidatus Helarchaeota archaeon]|nr:amidohydrolase family protein [Candidatus Helarchaeota archaeon]
MPTTFFSDFALIGENLDIKEKIYFQVSEEGLIKEITTQRPKNSDIVEFKDALVVPGFINAHVHIGDSFAKDKGVNLTLPEVVEPPNGLKHRLLKETRVETIIEGMRNGFKEMLSSGTTTFADFREGGPDGILILKEALKDSLIRAFILGRTTPDFNTPHEILKIAHGIGLSSSNLYNDTELEMFAIFCLEGSKIISTHVSETEEERKIAFERFKISDIERAIKILKANILIHAIHADNKDIELISQYDVPIVICPRANGYFGAGFPPISAFLKNKIVLCLGTDNVMANSPDLFREMEFLFKLFRGTNGINMLKSKDILSMVTINPAKALRLDHLTGSLAERKYADFFVLDLNSPNLVPMENIYDSLILRAKSENIIATYLKGRLAYERRYNS